MTEYYLVARNKDNNSFTILGLDKRWYLGSKSGDGTIDYANKLEAIDMVTCQFNSREQLIGKLKKDGYIPSTNTDLFIFSRRKENGKVVGMIDEVVYGQNRDRAERFAYVALNSYFNNMGNAKNKMMHVYEDIITRCYSSDDFYNAIQDGESNISKRFSALLKPIPMCEDIPYQLCFDREFAFRSYREYRNVVEFLNRFDLFSAYSNNDRGDMNSSFVEENYASRMALAPIISSFIEETQGLEQMSLFRGDEVRVGELASQAVTSLAHDIREDKTPTFSKKEIPVSVEKMKENVFKVLDSFTECPFRYAGDKKLVFNESMFDCPITGEEREKFNSLLTGNMPRFFNDYVFHTQRIDLANKCGDYSEASELAHSRERDLSSIKKRFKNSKCVADTYEWCKLFEVCLSRGEQITGGARESGEESGKGSTRK